MKPVVRKLLYGALILSITFTGFDLALLGHFEDIWQWIPIVLLAIGLIVSIWHAVASSGLSKRILWITMTLFIVAGLLGVGLHFKGNVEFEREMYPALKGFPLIWKTLRGATPTLAPGTMIYIGLLGLLAALIPYKTKKEQ